MRELMEAIAKDQFENNFEMRRGVLAADEAAFLIYDGPEEFEGCVAAVSNNPWAGREVEFEQLENLLAAEGIEVIAKGSYPLAGEQDEGYNETWLLEGPDDEESRQRILDLWGEALRKAYKIVDEEAAANSA